MGTKSKHTRGKTKNNNYGRKWRTGVKYMRNREKGKTRAMNDTREEESQKKTGEAYDFGPQMDIDSIRDETQRRKAKEARSVWEELQRLKKNTAENKRGREERRNMGRKSTETREKGKKRTRKRGNPETARGLRMGQGGRETGQVLLSGTMGKTSRSTTTAGEVKNKRHNRNATRSELSSLEGIAGGSG